MSARKLKSVPSQEFNTAVINLAIALVLVLFIIFGGVVVYLDLTSPISPETMPQGVDNIVWQDGERAVGEQMFGATTPTPMSPLDY